MAASLKHKRCFACGGDTSFMALVDGICIPCGDHMQSLEKIELIRLTADSLGKATARVTDLEKDAQAVVDAVKRLEWRQEGDEDCHRHCPDCGAMEPMGHYPECEFDQALRRWDARKN